MKTSKMGLNQTLEVLLVEDDPADVLLTRESLKEGKIAVSLNVVDTGQKALNYLRKTDQYIDVSTPDLILLDLNLPGIDGRQVLQEIKPYLEEGQILSFSIHSRGHTGIVSRVKDTWTLINSGRMNHSLESTSLPKGVGEESLEAEIRDWFKLARNRNESLRITLGKLNEKQLVTYYDVPPAKPKKV